MQFAEGPLLEAEGGAKGSGAGAEQAGGDFRRSLAAVRRDLSGLAGQGAAGYDMVMLGGCLAIRNRGVRVGTVLRLAQQSRCTHGMLVSAKGAWNMLSSMPIRAPIDWQINLACRTDAAFLAAPGRFGYHPTTSDGFVGRGFGEATDSELRRRLFRVRTYHAEPPAIFQNSSVANVLQHSD